MNGILPKARLSEVDICQDVPKSEYQRECKYDVASSERSLRQFQEIGPLYWLTLCWR